MSRKDKYAAHEQARYDMKLAVQKEFRGISIYTRHVGMFYIRRVIKNSAVNYTPIQIEKKGRCDDWAVLPCFNIGSPIASNRSITQCNQIILPIHIEIETKTGSAVLSPDQIKWRDKCFKKGVLWFENRNAEITVQNINNELKRRGLVPWTTTNNN